MILATEGILLRAFDFRETSRIAVFFTKNYGKVKGLLKGIRKDHRKFGSSLDKFSVNDIVYYQHRNSDLHLIGQCDLKTLFLPIRRDVKKTMAANYILELVNIVMPVEQENGEVYQLMLDYLESLQTAFDVNKLVHIFQVKILHLSGFRPHIDSCVVCQKKIAGHARFSMRLGGLLCGDCRNNDVSAGPISRGTIASILHLEKNDWRGSMRLGLAQSIQKELKYILNNFLVFHLERPIRTARYL